MPFDLIEHDGTDLRYQPLEARKARLFAIVTIAERAGNTGIVVNEDVEGDGPLKNPLPNRVRG